MRSMNIDGDGACCGCDGERAVLSSAASIAGAVTASNDAVASAATNTPLGVAGCWPSKPLKLLINSLRSRAKNAERRSKKTLAETKKEEKKKKKREKKRKKEEKRTD